MAQVFVAAGSNVEPQANLTQALTELARRFGELQVSPWYRNAAVGFAGEDFINFVFGFRTELGVHEMLAQLRDVETICGRPRNAPKWAARSMDLDVLLYDDLVLDDPQLKLPRPDLLLRPYMLGPLADIAPDLRASHAGPDHRRTVGGIRQRGARHAGGAPGRDAAVALAAALAAAAVHRQDLAGDERGHGGEIHRCFGDVLGVSGALEQGLLDDLRLQADIQIRGEHDRARVRCRSRAPPAPARGRGIG